MTLQFILPNIAYIINACSFYVRDMIWLRLLAMASSCTQVVFELGISEHARWPAAFWHGVFISINAWRVLWIIIGERRAKFSEDERELYETLFRKFTKLEFLKLMRAGVWKRADADELLATQGNPLAAVRLIFHGVADVLVNNTKVAEVRDGQLVGEMSFVAGGPATATVKVTEPTRYVEWRKEDLKRLLDRNPAIRFAMNTVIGSDLTRKLKKA